MGKRREKEAAEPAGAVAGGRNPRRERWRTGAWGAVSFLGAVLLAPTVAAQEKTLPSVSVTADSLDPDDARAPAVSTATKTAIPARDVPQTIESIEVSKFKTYGVNDLSVMLQGVAGVETFYDARGEGVMIRGFEASYGDFYRDGIRESGQLRRSTANIERIEVLKGPSSVLYGRGAGGGIVNMISRQASFDAVSSVGLRGGSWHNLGATVDINRVLSPNVAARLTVDREQGHSFRDGIRNRNTMVSPSILIDNHRGLSWMLQYTYDNVWRVPDRGPSYENMPAGVSLRNGFAHPGDFMEDRLNMVRSVLNYQFHPDWGLRWTAAHRKASQDFDHYYAGTYCNEAGVTSTGSNCSWPGRVRQNYAWQETSNTTRTQMLDLTGKAELLGMKHDLLFGIELTDEERHPLLFSTASSSSYIDPYDPPGIGGWTPRPVRGAPTQHNRHKAESRAFYLQDMIAVTPQVKALVGARYDSYDFRSTNQLNGQARDFSGSAWSPRAGIVWQPLRDHSFYLSWSKSYAPYGGRGMLTMDTAPDAVFDNEPQFSRQYEVGVKSDWLDGGLSTHVALYDLRKYNIRYRPDPIDDPYNWAVRGSEGSRGIELGATGRVTSSVYLRASLGFQDSKVREDVDEPSNVGLHLSNTGRYNGSLFARYVPSSRWYGEAGVSYAGSRWANAANTVELPGYARWDASVGWRPLPWTVTLAVSNLFDKAYWRSNAMPGMPRTVLLSASYLF